MDEYDQKFIIADIGLVQKVNKWEQNQVGGFELKLKDFKKMDIIEDKIYRTMLDQTLSSSTIKSQLPNIFEWLDLQKMNEFIILYKAAYIILNGLFWGNLIGLTICFLQKKYSIITLPEKEYYLNVAPIKIELLPILGINIGTFTICLLVLLIPSLFVSKINPVKTIRFN